MKFGKRLKQQTEETLPEWRDKFVSYKQLKKLVKLISAGASAGEAESHFVRLLDSEIDKFNAFFVEQEEDFIIRMREVQERIGVLMEDCGPLDTEYTAEMGRIRKDIVNLHGEMVLLENYSSINYTGLAKILKKYDKHTGRLLRLPLIKKVLKQPFFTTELISKLVNECERTMEAIFPRKREQQSDPTRAEREGRHACEQQSVFRSTVAALMTMQEMRKGSSTYSHFSLPPLSLPDQDLLLQSLQLPSPIPIQ